MTDAPQPEPLFKDSLDGGRGQKTLMFTRAVNGFLIVEMTLVVGRDTLGLSHPIHRTVVADLCKTLSAWLESPESVMRGGEEEPEFSIPNHDVSEPWLPERVPLPKGARTHCRECESDQIQCTKVAREGSHNVWCVCEGCGHGWYVSER